MTYASLKLLSPTIYEEMHVQEIVFFDLDLGVKAILNVAQYPLHHVAYSPAKFKVATTNTLDGDAFTRKYII